MGEIELSAHAVRLLKHFQDQQFRPGDTEIPAPQAALFDDFGDCEAAQRELGKAGLLELGPEMFKYAPSQVRSATLTVDGSRFLQHHDL